MTFQLAILLKQRINLVTSSSLVKQDENQNRVDNLSSAKRISRDDLLLVLGHGAS